MLYQGSLEGQVQRESIENSKVRQEDGIEGFTGQEPGAPVVLGRESGSEVITRTTGARWCQEGSQPQPQHSDGPT